RKPESPKARKPESLKARKPSPKHKKGSPKPGSPKTKPPTGSHPLIRSAIARLLRRRPQINLSRLELRRPSHRLIDLLQEALAVPFPDVPHRPILSHLDHPRRALHQV